MNRKTLMFLGLILFLAPSAFAQKVKEKDKKLPPNCTDGQVAKWEEGTQTWMCADDNTTDVTALQNQVNTNTGDIADLVDRVSQVEELNPLQVALLRWYEASEAGNDFAVGRIPIAVAFDGANIWVANQGNPGTVSKLRASDGRELNEMGLPDAGFAFAVGRDPLGVAFDGANIWVANTGDDTVTKLRASDGMEAAGSPFAVGAFPRGVVFDGANIWVANTGDNTVSKH